MSPAAQRKVIEMTTSQPKRVISKSARKHMALAQQARWDAYRAAKNASNIVPKINDTFDQKTVENRLDHAQYEATEFVSGFTKGFESGWRSALNFLKGDKS